MRTLNLRTTHYLMIILGLCFIFQTRISFAESPPPQTNKPQTILRIGTILPADVSYMKYNAKELREVEELTDHRVKFELYTGGVLGDEPALVKMVQKGKLDIAAVTSFSLEELVPEILVLSLPYLFRDEYEMEFILEKYESIFAGYARERGIEDSHSFYCRIFPNVQHSTHYKPRRIAEQKGNVY